MLDLPNDVQTLERDALLAKIREEVLKRYASYRETMKKMACDAPIQCLCLDKSLENILLNSGINRVYDLFDVDFVKIKGIGVKRCGELTACLDQFLSML